MRRNLWLASILLLLGCSLPNRFPSGPRPVRQQQLEATLFDPYADADAGPEVVGARPREFQRPASEAVRARGFGDTRWPF